MNERAKIAAMVALPVLAVGAVAGFALTAGDGDDSGESKPQRTALESARENCLRVLYDEADWWEEDSLLRADLILRIEDDGRSIVVESPTAPRGVEAAADSADCLVRESGGPESLVTKMDQTNALMGRQTDTYGDVEVSWNYTGGNVEAFSAIFELAD